MSVAALRGRLLVAAPVLEDPNFRRTVVLVLEHGEDGALGVVLNRPTTIELEGPLAAWAPLAAEPAVLFVGGPVASQGVMALGRARTLGHGSLPLLGDVNAVDLNRSPHEVEDEVDELRFFSGYAGWDSDQLEAEIRAGAWLVLDAEQGDPLCREPERLWARVLRRQRGQLALLSTFPDDPALN